MRTVQAETQLTLQILVNAIKGKISLEWYTSSSESLSPAGSPSKRHKIPKTIRIQLEFWCNEKYPPT